MMRGNEIAKRLLPFMDFLTEIIYMLHARVGNGAEEETKTCGESPMVVVTQGHWMLMDSY